VSTAAGGPVRVGTRASALALAQSGRAAESLVGKGGFELVRVTTQGDRDRTSPLASLGGTGVFVTAVREALLTGEVDLVVHSLKDLPTSPAEGIELACIPPRADARDALCSRDGADGPTLAQLPRGARVGTGSPRRGAQLLRARPDLEVVGIRGNVETRLSRAQGPEADLDAVVLAAAGLLRLGRDAVITELLDPAVVLPAPAQGALAIEVRSGDSRLADACAAVDDPGTRACVSAERSLLRTLEAGCSAPVAAHATLGDGTRSSGGIRNHADSAPTSLTLRALAISPDGTTVVEDSASGDPVDAERIGRELAQRLIEQGADAILEAS
jgi:hydroxymethylbilane synthase